MRHGSNSMQESATCPERYGYRWACPSCMKELQKVRGEPWDGHVTQNPMQWLTPEKVCKWRSTRWWHSLQEEMMVRDSGNHTS